MPPGPGNDLIIPTPDRRRRDATGSASSEEAFRLANRSKKVSVPENRPVHSRTVRSIPSATGHPNALRLADLPIELAQKIFDYVGGDYLRGNSDLFTLSSWWAALSFKAPVNEVCLDTLSKLCHFLQDRERPRLALQVKRLTVVLDPTSELKLHIERHVYNSLERMVPRPEFTFGDPHQVPAPERLQTYETCLIYALRDLAEFLRTCKRLSVVVLKAKPVSQGVYGARDKWNLMERNVYPYLHMSSFVPIVEKLPKTVEHITLNIRRATFPLVCGVGLPPQAPDGFRELHFCPVLAKRLFAEGGIQTFDITIPRACADIAPAGPNYAADTPQTNIYCIFPQDELYFAPSPTVSFQIPFYAPTEDDWRNRGRMHEWETSPRVGMVQKALVHPRKKGKESFNCVNMVFHSGQHRDLERLERGWKLLDPRVLDGRLKRLKLDKRVIEKYGDDGYVWGLLRVGRDGDGFRGF